MLNKKNVLIGITVATSVIPWIFYSTFPYLAVTFLLSLVWLGLMFVTLRVTKEKGKGKLNWLYLFAMVACFPELYILVGLLHFIWHGFKP